MAIEYLTVEDLKAVFHIGNTKAYKLCETRGFPAFRIGEGKWLIDPQGLQEWVQKLQKTNTKTFTLNLVISKEDKFDYSTKEICKILELLEPDSTETE